MVQFIKSKLIEIIIKIKLQGAMKWMKYKIGRHMKKNKASTIVGKKLIMGIQVKKNERK